MSCYNIADYAPVILRLKQLKLFLPPFCLASLVASFHICTEDLISGFCTDVLATSLDTFTDIVVPISVTPSSFVISTSRLRPVVVCRVTVSDAEFF